MSWVIGAVIYIVFGFFILGLASGSEGIGSYRKMIAFVTLWPMLMIMAIGILIREWLDGK